MKHEKKKERKKSLEKENVEHLKYEVAQEFGLTNRNNDDNLDRKTAHEKKKKFGKTF